MDTPEQNVQFIVADIFNRIQTKEVRLPSPPDLYLKVVEARDADLREIEKIIMYDASITARLIQVSNSPAIRGFTKATTLFEALLKLGTKFSSSLILGLSLRDRFTLKIEALRTAAAQVWHESLYTGVCSSILIKELAPDVKLSKEVALTCGLLHGIGKLPIIDYFSLHPELIEYLPQVLGTSHGEVGATILSNWGMETELISCTSVAPLLSPADEGAVSYKDIVALVHGSMFAPDSEFLPSYEKKVDLTVRGIKYILKEYDTEVEELTTSLGID